MPGPLLEQVIDKKERYKDMYKWNEKNNDCRQHEIVACMEYLRPAIYQIISNANENIACFDYYVDSWVEHEIILTDDGCEFASAKTDNFNTDGEFMQWVIEVISAYYEDQED